MKGINTTGRQLFRLFGLLLLAAVNFQPLSADDRQIVIVKSSDNSYFNQTIESLISHVDEHSRFKVINTDEQDSQRDILNKANIIVTLGASSASNTSAYSPKQLIINAYVTLEQTEQFQHENKNHIAVLLNQPLERYFAFSHALLKLKNTGTINRFSPELNSDQRKLLKKLKLKLNRYKLGDTNTELLAIVRQLVDKNDALLMLPEQSIYNRDTLKGILLTTYRSRTPVISYSPGHVKSGALAAIYSSPENIGLHLANLINQHHKGKLNFNTKTVYAQYYSIAINQRVAHSLGISLPAEEDLRKQIDGSTK